MKINEKSNLNLDKENKRNNQLNIEYPSTTMNYKTNVTANEAKTNYELSSTLPAFKMFKGFFNKKFNLTNYKNERDNSRSKSRSPERRYEPHKIRGNGISEDALERIHFLGTIFKNDDFQKYYANRPKKIFQIRRNY